MFQERTGFGGGFKIPEEYRKIRESRKLVKKVDEDEEDQEDKDQNVITKEEILNSLALGSSETGIGPSKYG